MSILGAVAGPLVSGLFGLFGSKKKQETTTHVDYQYIRDAASAAGFNPLTALMNGGSANATTISNAPALAAQDFVAEALAKSADTFFNRESYEAQRELERLEVDLAREKLAELRKTNSSVARTQSWGYGIPRSTNQTGVDDDSSGAPVLAGVHVRGADTRRMSDAPVSGARDILTPFGNLAVDSRWSSADDVESEYAEVGSFPYAVAKGFWDLGRSFGLKIGNSSWRWRNEREKYYRRTSPARKAALEKKAKGLPLTAAEQILTDPIR